MKRISATTDSLGLVIKKDEGVALVEILVYGKIPAFRGKALPLEIKR